MLEQLNLVLGFEISKVHPHELAKLGVSENGLFLLDSAPTCVAGLIERGCNPKLLL
jgi:hypothetical protein